MPTAFAQRNAAAVVAVPCAVFAAVLSLCLWILGREEGTPANALPVAVCHNITPGCVFAALQHSRNVLARLFASSFFFFFVLLVHCSDNDEDDSDGLDLEVREVSRGQQASARGSTPGPTHPPLPGRPRDECGARSRDCAWDCRALLAGVAWHRSQLADACATFAQRTARA
jgi:hypothetical protein